MNQLPNKSTNDLDKKILSRVKWNGTNLLIIMNFLEETKFDLKTCETVIKHVLFLILFKF